MVSLLSRLPLVGLALVAAPAAAASGSQIPEPSSLALFGLGLTGVIVGRQLAKRRSSDD